MKLLANGCRCSEIGVIPKNWKTTTSTKKNWKVYYRFYAPGLTGSGTKYPKGKLITTNGMNEFKDIHDRKQVVKGIIEGIKHDLENKDYNPITGYRKNIFEVKNDDYEIHPETPVMEALDAAYEKKKAPVKKAASRTATVKKSSTGAKTVKKIAGRSTGVKKSIGAKSSRSIHKVAKLGAQSAAVAAGTAAGVAVSKNLSHKLANEKAATGSDTKATDTTTAAGATNSSTTTTTPETKSQSDSAKSAEGSVGSEAVKADAAGAAKVSNGSSKSTKSSKAPKANKPTKGTSAKPMKKLRMRRLHVEP